jgi:hypothetical protein
MLWFGSEGALKSRVNEEIPVLRRAEAQAEAGPLMLMVRRANMGLSIAASRRNRKGLLYACVILRGSPERLSG